MAGHRATWRQLWYMKYIHSYQVDEHISWRFFIAMLVLKLNPNSCWIIRKKSMIFIWFIVSKYGERVAKSARTRSRRTMKVKVGNKRNEDEIIIDQLATNVCRIKNNLLLMKWLLLLQLIHFTTACQQLPTVERLCLA